MRKFKLFSQSYGTELLVICLLFCALLLLLLLLSYNGADQSSLYATNNSGLQNLLGFVGASSAYYLYSYLGYPAFMLPLGLIYLAFSALNRQAQQLLALRIIRGLSLLMLALSLCGLLAFLGPAQSLLPAGWGGQVGLILATNAVSWLDVWGSLLVFLFLVIISLSLAVGFSWLQIFEIVGGAVLFLSRRLRLKPVRARPIMPTKGVLEVLRRGRRAAAASNQTAVRREPELVFMPGHSEIASKAEAQPQGAFSEPAAVQKPQAAKATRAKPPKAPKVMPRKTAQADLAAAELSKRMKQGSGYLLPNAELFETAAPQSTAPLKEELEARGQVIINTLQSFGLEASILGYRPGPVVTMFEIKPAPGIKVSRISNLTSDLSRALKGDSVRVVEYISGSSSIGIEVQNPQRQTVNFRNLLESRQFSAKELRLPLALGEDISGKEVIADLAQMPHLLVAGTTGSGKSIGINTMILSLLCRRTPKELKLILVDPKVLELSTYNELPHLLIPVITDMHQAAKSIGWCVNEMERRYRLMAAAGVRNIHSYNAAANSPEQEILPYIVIVIDEYADMIMMNRRVEEPIVRLVQKSRAAGMHLILATQRPSVDVITGLIKANIPARISYKVSSRIDSRTILDQSGAEQLLGLGDMLYLDAGGGPALRVHGAFIGDGEIFRVAEHCKRQGIPAYDQEVLQGPAPQAAGKAAASVETAAEKDELYAAAVTFVQEAKRVSISAVQRKFKIGYNRAARIIETMEEDGVVSAMDTAGKRQVLE